MTLRSITCVGRIQSDGNLPLTDKGFYYSDTETNPTVNNSMIWSDMNASIDLYGTYKSQITGLTEATDYYINSYATNSMGTTVSTNPQKVTTSGIINYPVITINILQNGIGKALCEMGTTNLLTISGVTIKNDETIFTNGYINQESSPIPQNPIITFSGYVPSYNTSTSTPPVQINFSPIAKLVDTWKIIHKIYYNCGNPQYQISGTTSVDGVYPFLWTLNPNFMPDDYFLARGSYISNYFYINASITPNNIKPTNGKIISKREDIRFLVTPYNSNYRALHFAYPSSYGNIQFKLGENGSWGTQTLHNVNVSTGNLGQNYGITTRYSEPFKVLKYNFIRL
jgi:hypothetical protein